MYNDGLDISFTNKGVTDDIGEKQAKKISLFFSFTVSYRYY